MPYMLPMPTLQLRHPLALLIAMKPDDRLLRHLPAIIVSLRYPGQAGK